MLSSTQSKNVIFCIPLIALVFLKISTLSYGQSDSLTLKNKVDSLEDRAWKEIKSYRNKDKNSKADSVQRMYAEKFFEMYQDDKKAQGANSALRSAFMMWGNTGAVNQIKYAISKIDTDSEVWASLFHSISSSFGNSEKYDYEDYIGLLKDMQKELSHPKAKSKLRMELGEYYQSKNNEKAKDYYKDVLELNASSFDSTWAARNIYEINELQVGMEAPDFKASTISGDTVSSEELRGSVVLLEFWATWCGPCKPNIPHLKKVYNEYSSDDFQLIGVALNEDKNKFQGFIDKKGMEWPQILESRDRTGIITKKFNVNGIPDAYLIDKEGKIIAKTFRGKDINRKVEKAMSNQ